MTQETLHSTQQDPRSHRALIAAWSLFGVVFIGFLALKMWQPTGKAASTKEDLPILGTVPDTTLIDTSGKEFSTADLRGKVWVGSLIFTHCAAACPRMTSQFARFQARVTDPDIHLVSISVDPERDTPERMKEYGELAGADFSRWHFLTGDREKIVDLAENGFKMGTGQKMEDFSSHPDDASPEAQLDETVDEFMADEWEGFDTPPKLTGEVVTNDYAILHSDRFVLVDRQGRIRGYYPGLEDQGLEDLERDALRLEKEQ